MSVGVQPARPVTRARPGGRLVSYELASRRLLPWLMGASGFALTLVALFVTLRRDAFGIDFHHVYWPAARDVMAGRTPYIDPSSPVVAAGGAFVYPAPTLLLFVPFGLLPHIVADVLFTGATMVCVAAALRVLGVRDWRVYGVVLVWTPVFAGWQTANLTLPMVLGVALAWRHRERPLASGVLVAAVIVVKLFMWPLALWLLATRRFAAFGWMTLAAVGVNLLTWAVIGFDELPRYRALLDALTQAEERQAYSVTSLALQEGAARGLAYGAGWLVAALVGVLCVAAGRRGRDAACLTLAIAVALLASPLVWLHYLALLLVPVALARPRFGPIWTLPLVLWVCPPDEPHWWQLLMGLGVGTVLVIWSLRTIHPKGAVSATE